MTDMVTRVARAIWEANRGIEWELGGRADQLDCLAAARAAIAEMRDPTDEMLDKMNDVWVDAGEVSINVCFADLKELHAAAIDAALKENADG